MNVVVVGLGKMGLTLAAQYARKGHTVVGCDVRSEVVDEVNAGRCPVVGEAGLAELTAGLVAAGRLSASLDTTAATAHADVVVLIPPLLTHEDGTPDYAALDSATAAVGRGLHAGTTVVYETTVAVGDTRRRFAPLLERESGLAAGSEFHLAFSPERVLMGRILHDLGAYPKIVGGLDDGSARAAADFYRSALDAEVVLVRDCETAEFVKLAETTYRDVNIALANELAQAGVRLGVDAVHAFELANTQPYSHLHSPGAGVGGHCIPVYPRLLLSVAPELRIPRLSREVNDEMPDTLVSTLDAALHGLAGRTVNVVGLSYRPDVREATLSPTWRIVSVLRERGARVLLCDPYFSTEELEATGAEAVEGPGFADGTVLVTKHSKLRDADLSRGGIVVDGRPDGWRPRTSDGQPLFVSGRGWQQHGG